MLRAIVNLDPYTFAEEIAEEIADENDDRSAEEVLLSTLDATTDDKLNRFALRLALSGHRGIPRDGEPDFLTEAEAVFTVPAPQRKANRTKTKKPALVPKAKSRPAKTVEAA